MSELPRTLTPHSFLELQYVTTNPDNNKNAILLDTPLAQWITETAVPDKTLSRFATFRVMQGLVTVNNMDIAVQSERYDVSGTTYIGGVLCEPTEAAVSMGMAMVSFEGQVDEPFVRHHLARLRHQGAEQVVVDRFGSGIYAFDTSHDAILDPRGLR